MQSFIPLIPLLPLIGFIINGIFGKNLPKSVVGAIGTGSVIGSFFLSVLLFSDIASSHKVFTNTLFTWLEVGNWEINFSFLVDQLSVLMMLIITGIGSLIHIYSSGYMHEDEGFHKFFAYLNLFIFSMLLLVMGGNYMILFFGWEGVGLCSYLLIGFWYKNVEYGKAARKAFIMNRIGDLGLLLGVFMIFQNFGSLDYSQVLENAANIDNTTITTICILLFVGAMGKSAQIPLYTWLPDAMAGPTPVSALIHAATMVTAGVYMIIRSNALYSLSPEAQSIIMWVGLATSIFAAVIGLRQNDIKKVLAYSTVSQLGLMFIALGVGAYASAMFHLMTHAFFKALLFLGAGSVIHAMGGEQDIRSMGGLRKELPVTFWTFLFGTLAIIGFPLFSGFFSKDEILANIYGSQGQLVWGLTGISALITAIYMCRLLFVTFYGEFRGTHDQKHHLHESPSSMTFPLMILALLSLVGGLLNLPHFLHLPNAGWLSHWLQPLMLNAPPAHHLSESTEMSLMIFTTSMSILVLIVSYFIYSKKENLPVADAQQSSFARLIANKFYVDELYDTLFVKPINLLSKLLFSMADNFLIDGIVNGVGNTVKALGKEMKLTQDGNIERYVLGMVLGILTLLLFNFLM